MFIKKQARVNSVDKLFLFLQKGIRGLELDG